jgi:putative oxidoreductase
MTSASAASPTTRNASQPRRWNKTIWAIQIVLAAFFIFLGSVKLAGQRDVVEQYAQIGLGQWLRYLTGSSELAGGIGLLIPRLAAAAATGLVGLMIGATVTNLLVIGPGAAVVTAVLGGVS